MISRTTPPGWVLALSIAALALAASASSIANGFALDDVHLIVRPSRIHSLVGWWREFARTYWPESWGGDGYRPLTVIAFRGQWALGSGQPYVFHAANIVLHTLTSVAVLWLARGVLPLAAAWIAAALFAVHPVHTEAIANVVGQSELWVALFITLAASLYVHGRLAGPVSWRRWLAIGALYAIAIFFKEHAIVLPALLILAEATVVRDRAPLRQRLIAMRAPLLALVAIALCYLWARSIVVVAGLAGFVQYIVFQALDLSTGDRVLTMIGAAPEWLRLLLWPARLMTDYAPPYIDIAQGPHVTQLPGLLLLVGVLGLLLACWRRSPVTAFGLGWLVIALLPASNFVVPAGFIIAERTLYLPSVGALIALGSVIPWLYEKLEGRRPTQYAAAATLVLLVGLSLIRSNSRNRVWRDNDTLMRQGIIDSPNSYRAHLLLGVHLFESKRKSEGEGHYQHAMQLFPYDPLMTYDLAEKYRGADMCEPAIRLYRWLFTLKPDFEVGRIGLAACLLVTLKLDEARREAVASIRAGGDVKDAHAVIVAAQAARDSLTARRARADSATLR
jgi:hypothetical protein